MGVLFPLIRYVLQSILIIQVKKEKEVHNVFSFTYMYIKIRQQKKKKRERDEWNCMYICMNIINIK